MMLVGEAFADPGSVATVAVRHETA
jgi:hypothetical protein